jgi:hypothetical protein
LDRNSVVLGKKSFAILTRDEGEVPSLYTPRPEGYPMLVLNCVPHFDPSTKEGPYLYYPRLSCDSPSRETSWFAAKRLNAEGSVVHDWL